MKRTILMSFCCASTMVFAQQIDTISAPINLDPVSIYTQRKQPSNQSNQPIFQHQNIFDNQQEIKLIKRSNYAIDPSF